MLFRFNRLTLLANIVSLQFTEMSKYQPSLSYRASKSRFFPYIHCKFCRVCPTTKMSSATVKSSLSIIIAHLLLKVIPHNCIAHPFCAYFMASFSVPSCMHTLKTWQICLDIEFCQLKNGYSSPTSTGTPPFFQVIVINLS